MESKFEIKCRKCRKILITGQCDQILDAHANILNFGSQNTESENCESLLNKNELFLKEDSWPDWIHKDVEDSLWTKGKLKCLCDARIGSFDFVSGNRCSCLEYVLPSVHLVKSKVDVKLLK